MSEAKNDNNSNTSGQGSNITHTTTRKSNNQSHDLRYIQQGTADHDFFGAKKELGLLVLLAETHVKERVSYVNLGIT